MQPSPQMALAESISISARSDMIEWLFRALSSPKGIILETETPQAILSLLLEAKATSHEFMSIRLFALEERGQVWLVKD